MGLYFPNDFMAEHTGNLAPFDFYDSAFVANATAQNVLRFNIDTGIKKGWITGMGIFLDDSQRYNHTVTWRLFRNDDELPFGNFTNGLTSNPFEGTLGFTYDPKPIIPLLVTGGEEYRILVNNGSAVNLLCAARVVGFYDLGSTRIT